jgi:hypothetical protein
MKINKDSWHYKMWDDSFGRYDNKPSSTDLCRYCHRIFWQLVLRLFLALMICMMLWMLGWGFCYQGLILHTVPTLIISGVIVAIIAVVVLYARWLNRGRSYHEPKTLVGKYARAAKQGVCPMVEFTSTEEEE